MDLKKQHDALFSEGYKRKWLYRYATCKFYNFKNIWKIGQHFVFGN